MTDFYLEGIRPTEGTDLLEQDNLKEAFPLSLDFDESFSVHSVSGEKVEPRRSYYMEESNLYAVLDDDIPWMLHLINGDTKACYATYYFMVDENVSTSIYEIETKLHLFYTRLREESGRYSYTPDSLISSIRNSYLNQTPLEYSVVYEELESNFPTKIVYELCEYYQEVFDLYVPSQHFTSEIVDGFAQETDSGNTILVKFLCINRKDYSSFVVGYELDISKLEEIDYTEDPTIIKTSDRSFGFDIVAPRREPDELAISYEIETSIEIRNSSSDITYYYPNPKIEDIFEIINDTLVFGTFNPDYCSIAGLVDGQFICVLQSTVACWLSPFINVPIDVQYLLTFSDTGILTSFIFIGPKEPLSFEETDAHQPYISNICVVDGNYLLVKNERKTRRLNLEKVVLNDTMPTEDVPEFHWECDKQWEGGWVGNVYYPYRPAMGTYPDDSREYERWVGYPTSLTEDSVLHPELKKTFWNIIPISSVTLRDTNRFWEAKNKGNIHYFRDDDQGAEPKISIYNTYASVVYGRFIYPARINFLFFYSKPEHAGGFPQSSIHIPGVLPGPTRGRRMYYYLKNMSNSATAFDISLTASSVPSDVTLELLDTPDMLGPGEEAIFEVYLTYDPSGEPAAYLHIPLELSCWLVWNADKNLNIGSDPHEPTSANEQGMYITDRNVAEIIDKDIHFDGCVVAEVHFPYLFQEFNVHDDDSHPFPHADPFSALDPTPEVAISILPDSPLNNAVNVSRSPEFSWTIAGEYPEGTVFTSAVTVMKDGLELWTGTTTSTSITYGGVLDTLNTYTWKVTILHGGITFSSETLSFETLDDNIAPEVNLISPDNNSNIIHGNTVLLEWESLDQDVAQTLINTVYTGTTPETMTQNSIVEGRGTLSIPFDTGAHLAGTSIYWNVVVNDSHKSTESIIRKFTIIDAT